VYYFNLDEGILTLQTTDKNAVEKQRRSAFRMSGLAIDDADVLTAQSPDFPEVLNLRVTREGTLYKGALATDRRGFDALTGHALKMAGQHLDAIRQGVAAIAPANHRQGTPCAWCDWRPVCLFDARLDAGCVRRFSPIKPDEVLEKLILGKQGEPPARDTHERTV
jgi:ATP-dependent helicase/nuclease subunit B